MKIYKILRSAVVAVSLMSTVQAAELVSEFAESELFAEFETEFDRFYYFTSAGDEDTVLTAEGQINSRAFKKPSEKSNLEVFRSYQQELAAAGFTILTAIDDDSGRVRRMGSQVQGSGGNNLDERSYRLISGTSLGDISYLEPFTEYYLAAQKTEAGATTIVVVTLADRRNLYAVDTLETAAMEQNTVVLNLDAIRAQIASEGRIAVYGILFATGSASISPESAATLDTIAEYLAATPQQSFYIVGHTDDQGGLDSNMQLSGDRAEATLAALLERVPEAASRLIARGVGPLSPVSTNEADNGRQLNRRVELVMALD